MGKKPKTMKEWMTSDEGVNTLTQALSNLDNTKTFRFNINGNATTATTAESADKAKTAESADKAASYSGAYHGENLNVEPPPGSLCATPGDLSNPVYYWDKRNICASVNQMKYWKQKKTEDWGNALPGRPINHV